MTRSKRPATSSGHAPRPLLDLSLHVAGGTSRSHTLSPSDVPQKLRIVPLLEQYA